MTSDETKLVSASFFILGLAAHYMVPGPGWAAALPLHLIAVGFFFNGRKRKAYVHA
ncbi:hypothetical protein KUV57_11420 [Epibacterium sp. DP7N7-1]|nr:hypothetical protein [Epibacterium sp. DP7N7-1]